jgi:hypothetical protein
MAQSCQVECEPFPNPMGIYIVPLPHHSYKVRATRITRLHDGMGGWCSFPHVLVVLSHRAGGRVAAGCPAFVVPSHPAGGREAVGGGGGGMWDAGAAGVSVPWV